MAPTAGVATARMTIGRLSEQTGCHLETVRYYERIGLLAKPSRTAGGHRVYGAEAASRLAFIRRARELGFTLEHVRTLLRLADGGHYTCGQVRGLAVEHLQEVRQKVVDLRSIERALTDMAARCVGGRVPRCALIDALLGKDMLVRADRD
jgi:MerR family transcriptional regulator, mercuric resistance operon regulatory protein